MPNHEVVANRRERVGFILEQLAEVGLLCALVQKRLDGRLLVLALLDGLEPFPCVPKLFEGFAPL
jgi:hypothetical protein